MHEYAEETQSSDPSTVRSLKLAHSDVPLCRARFYLGFLERGEDDHVFLKSAQCGCVLT